MNYSKTRVKKLIRKALSECGYGRGYSKDYIHCPAHHVRSDDPDALEKHVYNDLHFKGLDTVAEMASEGDEIDAYVYSMRPNSAWGGELIENVVVKLQEDGPVYSQTSRQSAEVPLESS